MDSNGWDDVMTDAGEMPLVALLLPSRQRLFAKQGALATTPIQIDFLNQHIIFGDGSVFFGFNTAQFSEQIKQLTGFEWVSP
ncbi:MAG TPA: hypothetical protein PLZ51_20125 [Aggregatilineales bacterium]|nr:hypothetical protein [Aggregatilineales bacterium]